MRSASDRVRASWVTRRLRAYRAYVAEQNAKRGASSANRKAKRERLAAEQAKAVAS